MTPVGLALWRGRPYGQRLSFLLPIRRACSYDTMLHARKFPCSCSLFSIAVRIKSDILRSVAKDQRYETDSCSVCRDRGFVGDRR
jgi:hypothetical protein